MSGPLRVSVDGPVATLTIDRPDRYNALNAAVVGALGDAVVALAADDAVRVLVVTGSGAKAFSAGADLDELAGLSADDAVAVLARGQGVFRSLETCGKPVIAAVNGLALGGGAELALSCTFMLAAENASFGLPESGLGLIPGYGGTQRLPRLLGRHAASYYMLTGERLSAARAYECGMLPLPPSADVVADALAVAGRIAERSPSASRAILSAVDHGVGSLDAALAYETALAGLAVASPDAAEGIAAFREKRAAKFGGTA
jgi:enoyl-CoA hydratase